jgi:hypothetical protein
MRFWTLSPSRRLTVLRLLDRCRLRKGIINVQPAFGLDQVGCEKGVDHRRLSKTALSYVI